MKNIKYLLIAPCLILITGFLVIPLFCMFISTLFNDGQFTLMNYYTILSKPYVQKVFFRSMCISIVSTMISAVVGFPVSYFISKITKRKSLYIAMALFPLMTSPVVRSFSWIIILGRKGIVNNFLQNMGITSAPLSLLYNEFAMIVGFVQLFLPLMILSLVGVMDNIDNDLTLAANTLGASNTISFWKIIFPLSTSGLMSGSVLVFCGCLTAYTTPQLLGGSDTKVLATVIYQYGLTLNDWKSASVIAVTMIIVSLLVSEVVNLLARKNNPLL